MNSTKPTVCTFTPCSTATCPCRPCGLRRRADGCGRIHVKQLGQLRAEYLAKYLAKQGRPECFQGKRLWAATGPFKHCKVKDVEVSSSFTEAVKFCQAELQQTQRPFLFVSALERCPTRDPVKLKMACTLPKRSDPGIADLRRLLRE